MMHRFLLVATVAVTALVSNTASATPPGFKGAGMGHHKPGEYRAKSVQAWWPEVVDLQRLRQNGYDADPMGPNFDYMKAFEQLDLKAVKGDINKLLTTSQSWWPADYGNYAGLMIRLAWHSAGTYRSGDGRGGSAGGQQRFEPLNSWPDNGNLDKARRLLWPIKQKYGHRLSWGDLMVLAGNVALENAGFETYGFAGGREDAWEPELVYWGPETKFLESERFDDKKLAPTLSASEMGLIYVNPEGPNGNPDILAAAQRIRITFGRMGMNDEETAALIVGGHTLGKAHGAHKASKCVGPEPAAAGVEQQGLGWKNKCGSGVGKDATTSGLEGAWTATPVKWSNNYLENLYQFEWKKTKSPGGATQWTPKNVDAKFVPDAHVAGKLHAPVMFTTDLALRYDPGYGKYTKVWAKNPAAMNKAFARAWFKLTHRDMGPKARYVGSEVPAEDLVWQDPLPKAPSKTINASDVKTLKSKISRTKLSNQDLIKAAWAAASTYRDTDLRGGANGARVRLAPQKKWDVNDPKQLAKTISVLTKVQTAFNKKSARQVSLADIIVLGGSVGIERAAKAAGHKVEVPFTPGRVDASQAQTDVKSFNLLKPAADGFRNFYSKRARLSPSEMLIDRADLLNLTVPEMTVLVGGMRALDTNAGGSKAGVLTKTPGKLTNDFFVNLLDMSTEWKKARKKGLFIGFERGTKKKKWTATEVDLVFGSNSELRAVAEVYAYNDGEKKMVEDFVKAWTKVMTLDRFDLR